MKRNLNLLILLLGAVLLYVVNILQPHKITTLKKYPTQKILESSPSSLLVKVLRAIDGDTIELESGKKVRYIGIDTPELHHPKKPVQCFAQEAMMTNKKLVEGKQVRLEKDVSETDRYGRLLRFVHVENSTASTEATFINDYLVRQGFAFAATFPPDVKYSEQFKLAQREAMENNRGLWSKCK